MEERTIFNHFFVLATIFSLGMHGKIRKEKAKSGGNENKKKRSCQKEKKTSFFFLFLGSERKKNAQLTAKAFCLKNKMFCVERFNFCFEKKSVFLVPPALGSN